MFPRPLTLQSMIATLLQFWSDQGCVIHQGYDLEVGAGTFNPATFLHALGPEPFNTAYVEPSRRPQDGRYGIHPNRLQKYHQLQVMLKPAPDNFLDLYRQSLEAIGLQLMDHDLRFVHDDWENPTIGAWGLGWEVWLNGMEITQLTYFQAIGSRPLDVVSGEITYGVERIAMYLQKKDSVYDVLWNDTLTYGDIVRATEQVWSRYNFDTANTRMWLAHFEDFVGEALATLKQGAPLPAYDFVMKASHAFNILDSRGVISVTERTRYITRIRQLARAVADAYVQWREELQFPLLREKKTKEIFLPAMPQVKELSHFLLEIGCEELPASFVPIGIQQLESLSKQLLANHQIGYSKLEVWGSPRRLALLIHDLETEVVQMAIEKKGPAIASLFAEDGKLTARGKSFFDSVGRAVSCREDVLDDIRAVNGTEYLFIKIPESKEETAHILARELPELLRTMHFPKKMVWDDSGVEYPRPIRWLVALFGDLVIPFVFGRVATGNVSYGHRQLDYRKIQVPSAKHYREALREACVIVSQHERQAIIDYGLKAHTSPEVAPLYNPKLIEEVVFLTEHPFVTCAHFNSEFCTLPKELLMAEMIQHQKYFPMQRTSGEITNQFIVVCDNSPNFSMINGNEKALAPRLADGLFLFEQDLATHLDDFVERLGSVTYFEALGSLLDKVERMKRHAEVLYALLPLCDRNELMTAVHYCKADLVSAVVNEFAELQGIMGGYYLQHSGYSRAVVEAVQEHLRHLTLGHAISKAGILLSLVDRLDNLLACFILELKPTSSHDPYGLRRQSLEILTSLYVVRGSINIEQLLYTLASHFPDKIQGSFWVASRVVGEILSFIWARLKTFLGMLGFDKEIVAVVLPESSEKDPMAIIQAAEVIHSMRHDPCLEQIASTHHRLKKILNSSSPTSVEAKCGEEADNLFRKVIQTFIVDTEGLLLTSNLYLSRLSEFAKDVEAFLDNVHVNVEDEGLKALRLQLLAQSISFFGSYRWGALHF